MAAAANTSGRLCVRWRTDNGGGRRNNDARSPVGTVMEIRHLPVRLATACAVAVTLFGGSAGVSAQNSDTGSTHTTACVKDSAITAKIKARLAADHLTGPGDIHVHTDKNGVVWLSGRAATRGAADEAISVARAAAHVSKVHSKITIAKN